MKTFKENFKIARILTKKALKREGFIKYYIYYFMHIIFSFGILLSPFLVSKWKLASEIKEENNISITGLFEPVSGKGYFHLLVANLIKVAIYLGALLLVSLIGGLLFMIGYGIAFFGLSNTSTINYLIPILFTIPAGVILVMLIVALPFINVPNSYIVNSYPSLTPGRILKYSFYSMKNGGKVLMLKTLLFEYLTKILYLALGVGLPILLFILIKGSVGVAIMIILMALFLALFLYIDPIITLIALLIKSNIYDEVVFVKNSNKLTEININKSDIVIKDSKQETLNSLFKVETKVDSKPSYQNTLNELGKEKPKKVLVEEEIELEPIEEFDDEVELEQVEEKAEPEHQDLKFANILKKEPESEPKEIIIEEEKTIEESEPEPIEEDKPQEDIILEEISEEKEIKEEDVPQEEIILEEISEEKKIKNEEIVEEETVSENTDEAIEELQPEVTEESQLEEIEEPVIEEYQEEAEPVVEETPAEEITTQEEIVEEPQNDDNEEVVLEEIVEEPQLEEIEEEKQDNDSSDKELDELLASIPEKEEKSEDEELNELLNSIPEKSTKRGRKKKGE